MAENLLDKEVMTNISLNIQQLGNHIENVYLRFRVSYIPLSLGPYHI